MIDRIEILPDRWDHEYQPRLKGPGAFDACVVCGEPHDQYIIHLRGAK